MGTLGAAVRTTEMFVEGMVEYFQRSAVLRVENPGWQGREASIGWLCLGQRVPGTSWCSRCYRQDRTSDELRRQSQLPKFVFKVLLSPVE